MSQQAVSHNLNGDHDKSIPELMRALADETTTLVKQELDLAKAEMTQKGKEAGVGIGMFGAAGIVALFALGALTACFIAVLSPSACRCGSRLSLSQLFTASLPELWHSWASSDYSKPPHRNLSKLLKP